MAQQLFSLAACSQQIQALLQTGDVAGARQVLAQARAHYGAPGALRDWALLLNTHWQCTRIGRRVQLRQPTESDAAFLLECMGDDGFMSLFHPTAARQRSAGVMAQVLAQSMASMPRFKAQHWLIERLPVMPVRPGAVANSGQAAPVGARGLGNRGGSLTGASAVNGACGLAQPLGLLSVVDLVSAHERAELLVGIKDPEHRGVGLSTEATLLALDVCFNHIGLQKLTSMVLATNPHSQRSTLGLGFVTEGYRQAHFRVPQTGEFVDCHDNGMTVSAFRQSTRLAKLSMRLLGRNIALPPQS